MRVEIRKMAKTKGQRIKVEKIVTYRYNKVFIALVIVGLVAACGILGQRFQLEQQNRTVELVLDYEDVVELAELEGVPV
jgi:hypothetical protein